MTDKQRIAKLRERLEEIATLLLLDPQIPDRWVGHIETRIQEWFDDREKAWARNRRLAVAVREMATALVAERSQAFSRVLTSFGVDRVDIGDVL